MEGKRIAGKYRLGRLLGEGAFSKVYLAEDERGKRYACKISQNRELLAREAEIQMQLSHPLFPSGYEYGREKEFGWLMMEYLSGETLEQALKRGRRFSSAEAAEIGIALAKGLQYLHERRQPLLFRDVKPGNVMLEQGGRVRLFDLGCVCAAGERAAVAGTPGFGAPEQFQSGVCQNVTADVFGLGRTLETMWGGGRDKRLKRVIKMCIRENSQERLQEMRQVAELLEVCRCERGRFFDSVQRAILRGEIRLQKNIWR